MKFQKYGTYDGIVRFHHVSIYYIVIDNTRNIHMYIRRPRRWRRVPLRMSAIVVIPRYILYVHPFIVVFIRRGQTALILLK